jgi:hypothetical protein
MTDTCPTCKVEMSPTSIIETQGVKSEILMCSFCGKIKHTLLIPSEKPKSVSSNKVS